MAYGGGGGGAGGYMGGGFTPAGAAAAGYYGGGGGGSGGGGFMSPGMPAAASVGGGGTPGYGGVSPHAAAAAYGGGGGSSGGFVSPHGGAGGGTPGGTFRSASSGSEAGAPVIIYAYSSIATGDAPDGVDVAGRRPATLKTGQEAEKLQDVVYRTVGAAVELVVVPARVTEIMGAISAAGPRLAVVHITAHGHHASLLLEGESGMVPYAATADKLVEALHTTPAIPLLVLSACNSRALATVLLDNVTVPVARSIVATNDVIDDAVAVGFSTRLYRLLLEGRNLAASFQAAAKMVDTSVYELLPDLVANDHVLFKPGMVVQRAAAPTNLPPLHPTYEDDATYRTMAEVVNDLTGPHCRAVALVGSQPGVGTSVTALFTAHHMHDRSDFKGGVVWVPCAQRQASARAPVEPVWPAGRLAVALGFPPTTPPEALVRVLELAAHTLLVFDDVAYCECVAAAEVPAGWRGGPPAPCTAGALCAIRLVTVLATVCPRVRALVTTSVPVDAAGAAAATAAAAGACPPLSYLATPPPPLSDGALCLRTVRPLEEGQVCQRLRNHVVLAQGPGKAPTAEEWQWAATLSTAAEAGEACAAAAADLTAKVAAWRARGGGPLPPLERPPTKDQIVHCGLSRALRGNFRAVIEVADRVVAAGLLSVTYADAVAAWQAAVGIAPSARPLARIWPRDDPVSVWSPGSSTGLGSTGGFVPTKTIALLPGVPWDKGGGGGGSMYMAPAGAFSGAPAPPPYTTPDNYRAPAPFVPPRVVSTVMGPDGPMPTTSLPAVSSGAAGVAGMLPDSTPIMLRRASSGMDPHNPPMAPHGAPVGYYLPGSSTSGGGQFTPAPAPVPTFAPAPAPAVAPALPPSFIPAPTGPLPMLRSPAAGECDVPWWVDMTATRKTSEEALAPYVARGEGGVFLIRKSGQGADVLTLSCVVPSPAGGFTLQHTLLNRTPGSTAVSMKVDSSTGSRMAYHASLVAFLQSTDARYLRVAVVPCRGRHTYTKAELIASPGESPTTAAGSTSLAAAAAGLPAYQMPTPASAPAVAAPVMAPAPALGTGTWMPPPARYAPSAPVAIVRDRGSTGGGGDDPTPAPVATAPPAVLAPAPAWAAGYSFGVGGTSGYEGELAATRAANDYFMPQAAGGRPAVAPPHGAYVSVGSMGPPPQMHAGSGVGAGFGAAGGVGVGADGPMTAPSAPLGGFAALPIVAPGTVGVLGRLPPSATAPPRY